MICIFIVLFVCVSFAASALVFGISVYGAKRRTQRTKKMFQMVNSLDLDFTDYWNSLGAVETNEERNRLIAEYNQRQSD